MSWEILPKAIHGSIIADVTRKLWREVRHHGISAAEIREWDQTTYFPWLRRCYQILTIQDLLQERVPMDPTDCWADPQILIRFPDELSSIGQYAYHVDQEPPWAIGTMKYKYIIQVALTDSAYGEGCLEIESPVDKSVVPIPMKAGDVLIMNPLLPHRGSLNFGGSPRMALYYRLLARC